MICWPVQTTRERGIYRLDVILRDLERHRQGHIDISEKLFRVAQFELWTRAQRSPRFQTARDQLVRDAGVGAYFLSAMPPVSDP